jgi:ABC-type nitrate/sulfonate/bicarbonate transport system permease component
MRAAASAAQAEMSLRRAPERLAVGARGRKVSATAIAGIISVPLVLLLWEWISRSGLLNPGLFPPPTRVIVTMGQMLWSGQLLIDVAASGQRLVVGYFAGACIGVFFGALTGRYKLLRAFFSPVFQMLRPIPPISFVPIAVLWFGLGEFSKYFLVFWGVFFVVWINAHLAVSGVDQIYLNAAQALGAGERVLLLEVVLPAALPGILAGLRTALPIGFYSLVAGEIAGAAHGVAYMIELAHTNFQVDKMFAGLIVLELLSTVADRLFVLVASRLFPWVYPRRG